MRRFYVAWIAMLLVSLRTGPRPSKYALNPLGMVVGGAPTWEEVPTESSPSAPASVGLERARLARKRAEKTN